MNLCVTVEGSPRVNALPSSSSSTWPEMSNKSNPASLLPHLVDAARTLSSDNDGARRPSLSVPLFFSSEYQTFVVTEYLGGVL